MECFVSSIFNEISIFVQFHKPKSYKMKKSLFLLLLGINSLIYAQSAKEFTDLTGDYLGQAPPEDKPAIFAPGIISGKYLEHSAAVFSSDGNEVYWCSRENQESTLKIWFTKRIKNRWTKPAIFNPLGVGVNHFDPFVSVDNKRIYFGADSNGNTDIWFVERKGNGWNKPQSISSSVNNNSGQCQASLAVNSNMYYIDYRTIDNKWTCDILKSKFKKGNYLQPDTLPPSINSSAQDWTPYIAPDESYLIFSSNRQNEWGDLYICFHDTQTETWTEAINLGEPINTETQESFPYVSPDGKYLFFTRWTNEENDMDVYWVSTKFIDRLREQYTIVK